MCSKSIGVVVLNFINYQQTIECVNSILSQTIDARIVVVDNGSKNESAVVLSEAFEDEPNVSFIALEENLGYARGNNVGIYSLLKDKINYIVVCNSDILFKSPRCLEQMLAGYEAQVGLICPLIVNRDGSIDQRVECQKKFIYLRLLKKIMLSHLYRFFPPTNALSEEYVAHNRGLTGLQEDRYVVSGSLYVLTPDFFDHYDMLFPKTFLYYEEYATILLLHKAKIKTKIVKTDPILHIGEASTPLGSKTGSSEKRRRIAESGRKILGLFPLSSQKIRSKYRNWRA